VVVADGKIIKRTAPGVNSAEFAPLNGIFPFFVFDAGKTRIYDLPFIKGELETRLTFQNGIRGFVLIRNGNKQDHLIRQATPNIKPDEATWDPQTKKAAMTAFGRNAKGGIILVSMAGSPENENELIVSDITDVLIKLGAVDAILGGLSGDVQQYIRLSDSKEYWLTAKPGITSSMAKMFPEGRPLSNAIIIEG